jgi:hypothetical protein
VAVPETAAVADAAPATGGAAGVTTTGSLPVTGTGGVSVGTPAAGGSSATDHGAPVQTIPPVVGSNGGAATEGVRKVESKPVEPVDLVAVSGAPIIKRLAPILAALLGFFLIRRLRRRSRT